LFVLVEHGKNAQQFVLGGHFAIGDDGKQKLLGLLSDALYQRLKQALLVL